MYLYIRLVCDEFPSSSQASLSRANPYGLTIRARKLPKSVTLKISNGFFLACGYCLSSDQAQHGCECHRPLALYPITWGCSEGKNATLCSSGEFNETLKSIIPIALSSSSLSYEVSVMVGCFPHLGTNSQFSHNLTAEFIWQWLWFGEFKS